MSQLARPVCSSGHWPSCDCREDIILYNMRENLTQGFKDSRSGQFAVKSLEYPRRVALYAVMFSLLKTKHKTKKYSL